MSVDDVPSDAWSRMSAIVRKVVAKSLGKTELRARPLVRSVTISSVETVGTPHF
jgi:hypothetical protein